MRIRKKHWAAAALAGLALLCTCTKNNTSQKTRETAPPAQTKAEEPPQPEIPPEPGPIAGSVLDVVSPDSPIPPDVLEAMAGYGVTIKGQLKYWHTQSLDINDDGSKELLISNVMEWCGSGGCSVWLWQRTLQGLRNLLPTDDITAAGINLENESTNGYHNISVYHRAAGKNKEALLVSDLYVWDGKGYLKNSTTQHGNYLDAPLPATVWKVLP